MFIHVSFNLHIIKLKNMKNLKLLSFAVIFAVSSVLPAKAQRADIVALAAGNDNLKTLVAAVKAAGLVETLQGAGPFTVFAPTDEAFAQLPEGTLESLLKPENKAQLVAILTYHVVPGKVYSTQLSDGMNAKTVEGSDVRVQIASEGAKINDAAVVTADVEASNGVVHMIDKVILPPAK